MDDIQHHFSVSDTVTPQFVGNDFPGLAQSEWLDENGLTWLAVAPKIKLLPDTKKRQPYPLNWDEQQQLFSALPTHLAEMALYAVNTGCRDAEICNLRWDWEVKVPALKTFVFIVPGESSRTVPKGWWFCDASASVR